MKNTGATYFTMLPEAIPLKLTTYAGLMYSSSSVLLTTLKKQ